MNERTNRMSQLYRAVDVEGHTILMAVLDDLTDEELRAQYRHYLATEDYDYLTEIKAEADHRGIVLRSVTRCPNQLPWPEDPGCSAKMNGTLHAYMKWKITAQQLADNSYMSSLLTDPPEGFKEMARAAGIDLTRGFNWDIAYEGNDFIMNRCTLLITQPYTT